MIKLKEIIENETINEFVDGFDLELFKNMKSYKERVTYANEKMEKIAAGTARIVYVIDDRKVLKLAKNKKGNAQNEVEADFSEDSYVNKLFSNVLEHDDKYEWLVSERAKRVNKKRIVQFLDGVPIDKFIVYMQFQKNGELEKVKLLGRDIIKKIKENEFASMFLDLVMGYSDVLLGDFRRDSSYGEIDGRLVIVDYGLTKYVLNNFYLKKFNSR